MDDALFAIIVMMVGFGVITWYMIIYRPNEQKKNNAKNASRIRLDNEREELKKRQLALQESTLSTFLNVPAINIIVREHQRYGFYKVKTNDKTYTVKFSSDYTEVEKIVEGTLI